ncbi:hypothetical protein FGB62_142g038 [Gracilaria domingensis]|nr:hypothetical protein FGB62_142g038 [Gracilaria domingensis]
MSSAQYPIPKPPAAAPDSEKRNSSNSYVGGDWFDTPTLQSKRTQHPPQRLRSTPPPPPPPPPPPAPNASDSASNGFSVFQPRSRGERKPYPQNRQSSNAAQHEPSPSGTRRLPSLPGYMSSENFRKFQTKSAPTLCFTDSSVTSFQFRNLAPRPPPPPPRLKPNTPVVNLDDETTPTSTVPAPQKQPELARNPPSARLSHPYQNDLPESSPPLPPVPKKDRNPTRISPPDLGTTLNHTRATRTDGKPPVGLRSARRNRASEQPKRNNAETICVDDDAKHGLVPKSQPSSLTAQQAVVVPSRSPSPAPKPNVSAKRQHPIESPKFSRTAKRPRHAQHIQRRSLRLQDKQNPDQTNSNPTYPFTPGFHTGKRYPQDKGEFPRSVATKPPRVMTPSDSDDAVTVVQSKNTKRTKRRLYIPYENTSYDHRHALSHLQKENTRYIKLSFMGMSDGDLRKLFDCGVGIPDLPSGGRHIQLNNNRLRHITSYMFQRLKDMKVTSLILSSNLLTQIDHSLVFCTELKTLDLSRNNLRGLPEQIGDLSNLHCLNVSDNELTKLPALYLLRKLKILNVARNNLESFPEDITGPGNALTALDVSGNPGFQCFPACCKTWDSLEDLILTGTEIFVYLTKKERKLRASALIEELAGKSLEHLKNRTRRRRTSVRHKETSDAPTTPLRKTKSVLEV